MVCSPNPLFALTDVHKRFGPVVALNGASVRLAAGEVRALVGGNGSGKSTLAKILMGILDADRSHLEIGGETSEGTRANEAIRITGTFQEVSLLDDLSVQENLLLVRLPRRLGLFASPRKARSLTTHALEQVLLPASVLDTKVRDLPLDQRALAELAKVLLSDPQVVIMDELTASLRAEQVEQVGTLLRELSSHGVATLFVSHRLEEVQEFCTTCTVLRNGATVLETDNLATRSMSDYVGAMTATGGDSGASRTRRTRAGEAGGVLLDVQGMSMAGWRGHLSRLHADAGEIIGLGGLAGNGQSEMLRGLFGSTPSSVESLEVDGDVVTRHSLRRSLKRGIGFISGEREREMVFGQRSVDENLSVVAQSLKKAFSSRALMDRMQVVGQPKHAMRSLSGGNQQKVIVGRWLQLRPKVLLADDPTRGVDVATRGEIHRLLRELTDEGSTVVLTSSDDRELAEICDRVYVIYRGRIVAELTGDEVTEEDIGRVSIHPRYQERDS
jgi:ribose transport system ATP-binding protein